MQLRSALAGIIVTVLLSSCSAIAPLAKEALLGGAKQGIEARANISKGDAEGDSSVAQNANTAVSLTSGQREVFEGSVGTVVNEAGMPIHLLMVLILLAGWAIPSPSEMGKGCLKAVRVLRSNQE